MVEVAVKVLAVIVGFVAGVWAYPYLNEVVFALLAFVGAVAVGVVVGALALYFFNWLLGTVKRSV